MSEPHKVGDLVHIPQAVRLLDCDDSKNPQLSIPLRVCKTTHPQIGIVTQISQSGYVRVFYEGSIWSVKDQNVYRLQGIYDGTVY